MKLYSLKQHRTVERQIHFGIGQSVETACGLFLPSRHIMVSLSSSFDGIVITADMKRVTCKRCLKTSTIRLLNLITIETSCPGVLDRPALCGREWLLKHALDISQPEIDDLKIQIESGTRKTTLSNKMRPQDRKHILNDLRVK